MYGGGDPLRRQHLARAEPLTALPRSARSRVSLSPSGCLLRGSPPPSHSPSELANAAVARRTRSWRPAQTPAAERSTGLSAGARRAKLGIVERETRMQPSRGVQLRGYTGR